MYAERQVLQGAVVVVVTEYLEAGAVGGAELEVRRDAVAVGQVEVVVLVGRKLPVSKDGVGVSKADTDALLLQ